MQETLSITDDLSIIVNDELIIDVKNTQTILSWTQVKILATILRGLADKR